ncbi:MAG: AAA family ATPase [Gammaproteobacteria bacterium]|nr:AAA family ATPase [Gammaproteobacteria bacterium]
MPIDSDERAEALNPSQSYIVQAPAGSGKTGLLVRRFLLLLSTVDRPEEILAITFTRKATAEMKERILLALVNARDSANSNDQELHQLATIALENNARQGWEIINNPARLRIQTIDAFCYELIRHMPWSSRFGAPPSILEDAEDQYLAAAKRTLDHVESESRWSVHCENLLQLVDANFHRAQTLLRTMLVKRDRWMRGLPTGTRQQFETMWASVINQTLLDVDQRIPMGLKQEFSDLADIAASRLIDTQPGHPLLACLGRSEFPSPSAENLPVWQGLSSLALTQAGSIRASVTKNIGFPTDNKPAKERMLSLLQVMRETDGMEAAFAVLGTLPNGQFEDQQWLTIESLLELLPLAAAELRLLFKEQNQTDYVELTQRAEAALGSIESPTDLSLSFDYRLKHILVDEFQDTSRAQIDLLLKLTAGWQSDDGRTLFLVGDPMQSIYRFREAEVGHFLEVQENGLGQIHPESIRLQSNFRSSPALVTWFNQTFQSVFPAKNDIVNSAVKYSLATPHCSPNHLSEAVLHNATDSSREQEAHRICALVRSEIEHYPTYKIAVLGRSRTHLSLIAKALRETDIPFQATEMEPMAQHSSIQDLVALTSAFLQPADRIAWLSVLRAPWCGLRLDDLSILAGSDHVLTISELSRQSQLTDKLSEEGAKRLDKLLVALEPSLKTRGRVSLRNGVESAWLSLAAPTFIPATQFDDCRLFFELLDKLESNYGYVTPTLLANAVAQHWTQSDLDAQVQLLTIHKAKGLEFDTVIIPGLERTPRSPEREMLRWARLPAELLIALLPANGEEDKFYQFLGALDKSHQRNELSRLMYVACTRAKQRLHLFGNTTTDKDGNIKPPANTSLLHLLWPVWSAHIASSADTTAPDSCINVDKLDATRPSSEEPNPEESTGNPMDKLQTLSRLPLDFNPPTLPQDLTTGTINPSAEDHPEDHQIEYAWASDAARVIGIAIHQMLQQIDDIGWDTWRSRDNGIILAATTVALMENGLHTKDKQHGINQITLAIANLKSDPRAEWIFSPSHRQLKAEWALTTHLDGRFSTVIMDRTFIDDEGTRWIIDFKSSRHEESDIDDFIVQEKIRYQSQLNHYAKVLTQLENRKTRLALYFPLLKTWTEWPSPHGESVQSSLFPDEI